MRDLNFLSSGWPKTRIREYFALNRTIHARTAAYGHFGWPPELRRMAASLASEPIWRSGC